MTDTGSLTVMKHISSDMYLLSVFAAKATLFIIWVNISFFFELYSLSNEVELLMSSKYSWRLWNEVSHLHVNCHKILIEDFGDRLPVLSDKSRDHFIPYILYCLSKYWDAFHKPVEVFFKIWFGTSSEFCVQVDVRF